MITPEYVRQILHDGKDAHHIGRIPTAFWKGYDGLPKPRGASVGSMAHRAWQAGVHARDENAKGGE